MNESIINAIQLKSKYEHLDKKKGYERTYEFYVETGQLYASCDVYGQCIGAATIYRSADSENDSFSMKAKGKFLNFTYYLEDKHGVRFATITRKGIGFRWKILDNKKREIARIIDPASNTEAFFKTLFTALPDSYAILHDKNLIATIQNEKLSKNIPVKPRNLLGKILEKVFIPRGLTLRLENDCQLTLDSRILLAGMTLLHVHDIIGVHRG